MDRFLVELSNLTAAETYQVTVSSDSANVGIDDCGTRSQQATVTGVADHELVYLVYACAVGEATVTAEVWRTGASSAEASISQRLTVEAIPENAIGARGERVPAATANAVPKAGTPGSVPDTYFSHVTSNSARANWGLPSDGGTPLTGYGLLFWRDGTPQPPYSSALVRGPEPKYYPYSNLDPATTYKWRIHACNASGSCGIWTVPIVKVTTLSEVTPTPTPTAPPTGPPAKPHSISVDQRMQTSARVNWSPSSNTGGMALTGFGIRWRVKDTSWPTHAQHNADDDDRNYTMPGLSPNTKYEVSLQSCNGTDSCSPWTSPLEFRTPSTAGRPAKPHTILFDDPVGMDFFTVRWSPALNTGGADLTGFGILVRKSGPAWPADSETTWVGASARSHTESGLDAGTAYVAKVKACNGAGGRTSCSDWSADSRVTTAVEEPFIPTNPAPPLPPPTCDVIDTGNLPPAPTALDPITNLTIEPRLQRQAVLRWAQVPGAREYKIDVRRLRNDSRDGLTWDDKWGSPTTRDYYENRNCYSIDLDNVIKRATSSHGLLDSVAFSLRVTANRTGSTSSSAEIILVDNPITVANGHSPPTPVVPGDPIPPSRVQLAWKSLSDLPTDSSDTSFSGGTYHFRLRRVAGNHDKVGWQPDVYAEIKDIDESDLDGDRRYQGLVRESIYAIQAIYSKANEPLVFSAVHAYVWPSNDRAEGGQRVAGFPLTQRLPSDKTYVYRVCDETFDVEGGPRKKLWLDMLDEVMGKWQSATNDLIRTRQVSEDCTDYSPIAQAIFEEIDLVPHITDKTKLTTHIKAFLTGIKDGLVVKPHRNIIDDINRINEVDKMASEIILFDDDPGTPSADFAGEINFKQIAHLIGYSGCWDPVDQYGKERHERGGPALACAVSEAKYKTTDIFIYRVKFTGMDVGPADITSPDTPCRDDGNSAYAVLMHEIGHALGVGGGGTTDGMGGSWSGRGHHPHHSMDGNSVLRRSLPKCSPYPFDVLAMYALYQSPS